MAKHIVKCRICKQEFDTNVEEAIVIGQKSYYHKSCYTEWVNGKDSILKVHDKEFYKEALVDYLYRDVKLDINFTKLESQWNNYTKPDRKMTPKGIYFAVRYFYEVQHGDKEKAQNGIGIVPLIYAESREYWAQLENKKEGTIDAIVQQIQSRMLRPIEKFRPKKVNQKVVQWDLNDI